MQKTIENQHLLTVAYHLVYRASTETYSCFRRIFQPKSQHRLANSSSQSHSKPYTARNASYWDSKRFRTSSHGFTTRHRLLVKLGSLGRKENTHIQSNPIGPKHLIQSHFLPTLDDFALQRLAIHWTSYVEVPLSITSVTIYCPSHHA